MGFIASWGWPGVAAAIWIGLMLITALAFALRLLLAPGGAAGAIEPTTPEAVQSYERSSQRLALLDLVRRAEQKGWDVSGRTIEIRDFLQGLREAGLDARVRMWGRPHRKVDPNAMTELHRLIPVVHWKDYELDVGTIAGRDDNFETRTCNVQQDDRHRGAYVDLYVDRQAALDWLDSGAEKFRRVARR